MTAERRAVSSSRGCATSGLLECKLVDVLTNWQTTMRESEPRRTGFQDARIVPASFRGKLSQRWLIWIKFPLRSLDELLSQVRE